MRTRLALLSLLAIPALIAGCGVAPKVTPQPTASAGQAKPQIGPGTVMTDALTEAQCSRKPDGVWTASGVIENTTKKALAFDITIYVGPPGGEGRTAHVTHVPKLAPGKTAPWASPVVETDAPGGPCHIRVRVAK
jgi:hypothetical protein